MAITSTAFGPQSPNYVTVQPTTDLNVSGVTVDTWFKDCSSVDMVTPDGTILTAGWLNVVLGNLRQAIRDRYVTLTDGDNTLLSRALSSAGVVTTSSATVPVYLGLKAGDQWFDTTDGTTLTAIKDDTGVIAWFQMV